MQHYTLLACSLLLSFALSAQSTSAYFTNHPTLTPDGGTIIFSYEGDLWRVPATGGEAVRLTAMQGEETHAKVSPDGRWLAFSGTQFGNADIYVMPLAGGAIRQLTWHEANDELSSWSWDSQQLYFTSSRRNMMSTYRIAAAGGTPERMFGDNYFNTTHLAVEHPTSGEIYFNESWESSVFAHRRGYKGAYNPDVQAYNSATGQYKSYTDYEGKDFGVTIDRSGNVYFVSDEYNDAYNLYTFRNGEKTRLTNFDEPIKSPFVNADGGKVVFQKDYQLYLYDVAGGQSQVVPVRVISNPVLGKTRDFTVAGNITAFAVAGDKKKLAFVSRGELFVSDIEGKFIRQLPTRKDGRVREVYWLKDNKTLIYNQTVDGYLNWFTRAADGGGVEKQLTKDAANNRQLAFNGDKTKAVYLSGREELRLLNLSNFESKTLLKEEFWGLYNDQPQFSPDDRYILFSAYRNFEKDLFVYDLQQQQKHNLTNTGVTEMEPRWSPDGRYIYFTSNQLTPSYPFGLQGSRIYRMALRKFDEPYRSDKFNELFVVEDKKEEKAPAEESKKKEQRKKNEAAAEPKGEEKEEEKEKVVVKIDFEDLMERVERISPDFGSQSEPYVLQKDDVTTVLYISDHAEGKNLLWKTTFAPFEDDKTEKIEKVETGSLNLESADGSHYLLLRGNLFTFDLGGDKTEMIEIEHTFRRNLQDEFAQMFHETWANLEENFYDGDFHGVDWPAMRDKYAAYLPHLTSRADLRLLLNDMLGELNTSHFGFYSSGEEEKPFYGNHTMEVGLEFAGENPYQVKKIIPDSPADRVGKDIQAGDVLTAVNGRPVDVKQNREFYFTQPSRDQELLLTFRRGGKEHTVKLHPVSPGQLRSLRYDEWTADNQQRVDKQGNKRVAYVHMRNMGGGELDNFLREMVSEGHQREGIILDLRYNTGGNVHDKVLQFLSQRPYLQWKYRGGAMTPQPNFAPAVKPLVLLINEQSLSDAEMTAQGFRELGLGAIIGTETYRWIIFTSGQGLVDGSFYRLPSWGCYTLDGKNLEKTGVAPDIVVKNTFLDRLQGNDPQLDRAIQEVMRRLEPATGMKN